MAATPPAHPRARERLLLLYHRLSKWDRLGFILDALLGADNRLVSASVGEFETWLVESNRSFVQLAPFQRAALERVLPLATKLLPPRLARELAFALKTA